MNAKNGYRGITYIGMDRSHSIPSRRPDLGHVEAAQKAFQTLPSDLSSRDNLLNTWPKRWTRKMSFHASFFNSCNVSGAMDSKSINLDSFEKTPRYHYLLSFRQSSVPNIFLWPKETKRRKTSCYALVIIKDETRIIPSRCSLKTTLLIRARKCLARWPRG